MPVESTALYFWPLKIDIAIIRRNHVNKSLIMAEHMAILPMFVRRSLRSARIFVRSGKLVAVNAMAQNIEPLLSKWSDFVTAIKYKPKPKRSGKIIPAAAILTT